MHGGVLQRGGVQEHAENKCHGLLSQTTVDFIQGGKKEIFYIHFTKIWEYRGSNVELSVSAVQA